MRKLEPSAALVRSALVQSLIAAAVWLLAYLLFLSIDAGVDADKPSHQVTLGYRLEGASFVGIPAAFLTLAAIMLWRRLELGWWLCLAGNCIVAMFGVINMVFNLPSLSDLYQHPALKWDAAYSVATLLVPIIAMILLFSRPLRVRFKAASESAGGAA
jgi:hypothetical protein